MPVRERLDVSISLFQNSSLRNLLRSRPCIVPLDLHFGPGYIPRSCPFVDQRIFGVRVVVRSNKGKTFLCYGDNGLRLLS
jgi:hypothetical protein